MGYERSTHSFFNQLKIIIMKSYLDLKYHFHIRLRIFLGLFILQIAIFQLDAQVFLEPCFDTEFPTLDGTNLGPNTQEIVNASCEDLLIQGYAHLPDEFMYPACDGEQFGSVQLSFGAHILGESSPGMKICVEYNLQQEFVGASNLKNVIDDTSIRTVCGELDLSELSSGDQDCGSFFIKYTEWTSPNPSAFNFQLLFDITTLENNQECADGQVNTFDLLPDENPWTVIDQHSIYLSSLWNSGDDINWIYINESSELIIDIVNNDFDPEGIILDAGASIKILDPLSVTFDNMNLRGCEDGWRGVNVNKNASLSFVNGSNIQDAERAFLLGSGGGLFVIESSIKDNNIGILSYNESTIGIRDSEISNNKIGMDINGPAYLSLFRGNVFDSNTYGVQLKGSVLPTNLRAIEGHENLFSNNYIGINTSNASARIAWNNFADNFTSIQLNSSGFTEIHNNNIGYNVYGLHAYNGSNFRAFDNVIGLPDDFGNFGVWAAASSFDVRQNTIRGKSRPASVLLSPNAELDGNTIFLEANSTSQSPIAVYWSQSEGIIHNNTIDMDDGQKGIEVISTQNTDVINNTITASDSENRSVGIAVSASTNNLISRNDIEGDLNSGIRLTNASSTIVECNQLNPQGVAVLIDPNSAFHTIRGNTLNGNIDVMTSSELGVQYHHGNHFIGGTILAPGLNSNQVFNSRFVADCLLNPTFCPQVALPSGFLEQQFDFGNVTYYCSGVPVPLVSDSDEACHYLNQLIQDDTYDDNERWIGLYHFYSSYRENLENDDWSECAQEIWDGYATEIGLKTLIESDIIISLAQEGRTPQRKEYLLNQIKNSKTPQMSDKSYGNVLNELKSLEKVDFMDLQHTLSEEVNVLQSLSSDHPSSQLWLSTKVLTYKKMMNLELTNSELDELKNTAELCALEYGDPVHWARSILSEYGDTDYSLFDDCEIESRSSKSIEPNVDTSIKIYPNPTLGSKGFNAELPIENRVSSVRIYDANRNWIDTVEDMDTADSNVFHYSKTLPAAVYFIEFKLMDGSRIIEKLIVIH